MQYKGKSDESQNDLMHWKYIRKYRNSKGKWTYVYADKSTHQKISSKETNKLTSDFLISAYSDNFVSDLFEQASYVASTTSSFINSMNNSPVNRPHSREKRVSDKQGTVYKK